MTRKTDIRLAIAGLGAIGMKVARTVDAGDIPGIRLTAVSARDREAATARVADFNTPPEITGLADLAEKADVIVECAPAAVFEDIARPALQAGRTFMPLSVGALLKHMDLVDLAKETGGRIIVPTAPSSASTPSAPWPSAKSVRSPSPPASRPRAWPARPTSSKTTSPWTTSPTP